MGGDPGFRIRERGEVEEGFGERLDRRFVERPDLSLQFGGQGLKTTAELAGQRATHAPHFGFFFPRYPEVHDELPLRRRERAQLALEDLRFVLSQSQVLFYELSDQPHSSLVQL